MEKYCTNCGKEVKEDQDVCLKCGALINKIDNKDDKSCKFAITGFILGFIGIIAWLLPLIGYPVTICGIVFSAKGLKSNDKAKAITGLVLSIIFCFITLCNSIAGVVMWAESFNYYL